MSTSHRTEPSPPSTRLTDAAVDRVILRGFQVVIAILVILAAWVWFADTPALNGITTWALFLGFASVSIYGIVLAVRRGRQS